MVVIASAPTPVLQADQTCRVSSVTVSGASMAPRYVDGQQIVVSSGGPKCAEPFRRSEAVVVTTNSHVLPLLKVLRGLPGDAFSIHADKVVVNGRVLSNSGGLPYQLSKARVGMLDLYVRNYHGVIPPDTFLVMGEDPAGSLDSSRFGLITRDAVIGRVVEPLR